MELTDYRKQLDEMDARIAELLNRRMDCCREIGTFKKSRGLPVYDEAREQSKLKDVTSFCSDDNAEGLREIYAKIMEVCRSVE